MPLLKKDRVKQLREAKGWSQETLSTKAIMSLKTISSIENGASARISTVGKLAKALGVEPSALLAESTTQEAQTAIVSLPPTQQPAGGGPNDAVEVVLKIRLPFERFDETKGIEGILAFLAATIRAKQAIVETEVLPGSIVMILRMDEEDAMALAQAMLRFELDAINVEEISTPDFSDRHISTELKDNSPEVRTKSAEIEANFDVLQDQDRVTIRRKIFD